MDVMRFRKVCGLLGSDQDGERASASLKATAMLKESGLGWGDVSVKQITDPNPNGLIGAMEEIQLLKSTVAELRIRNRFLSAEVDALRQAMSQSVAVASPAEEEPEGTRQSWWRRKASTG